MYAVEKTLLNNLRIIL